MNLMIRGLGVLLVGSYGIVGGRGVDGRRGRGVLVD